MKRAIPLLLLAAVGCAPPEERHFRTVAKVQCKMEHECSPEDFDDRFDSVDQCIDASEVGVGLYAEACRDFDASAASRCRMFMREARRTCDLDTSDARYEDFCLGVCSNYQGP
jgi:hypothetical protein